MSVAIPTALGTVTQQLLSGPPKLASFTSTVLSSQTPCLPASISVAH
jgi:hypothetical protein